MEEKIEQEENLQDTYEKEFSKPRFFSKVDLNWKKAGKKVIETSVQLFLSFQDSETPKWAKAVIVGALGYFISPIDAIPDFTPVLGFTDDLGVMLSALAVVAIHVKDTHRERAKDFAERIFGK